MPRGWLAGSWLVPYEFSEDVEVVHECFQVYFNQRGIPKEASNYIWATQLPDGKKYLASALAETLNGFVIE